MLFSTPLIAQHQFTGADGEFTLYEDENDNFNYEKDVYSLITFYWDNTLKTHTISDRKGEFPEMLKSRKLDVVLVSEDKCIGVETTEVLSKSIKSVGEKLVENL